MNGRRKGYLSEQRRLLWYNWMALVFFLREPLMPSPFPGMDPFIEQQKWTSFHTRFITELCDVLVAKLSPRYEVDPEERIYLESLIAEPIRYQADVAVHEGDSNSADSPQPSSQIGAIEPAIYTLPMPEEQKEHFVVVRKPRGEVVTVIEVLSPTNKRKGSDGRREYLAKRGEQLRSSAHLVELDLLLGGARLPTLPNLKAATDYCALISRAGHRPRAEVFEWSIRHPLPSIPIPLLAADPDVLLDLQSSLTAVYSRAHYRTSLDYREPLELPIRDEDLPWVHERLEQRETTRK